MKPLVLLMARHWGMCFGVRDALALVEEAAAGGPVTVLGELVHNPVVHEKLRDQGILRAPLETSAQAPTHQVAITAHGTSDRLRRSWAGRGHRVIDTTCPLVRSAHQRLADLVNRGFAPVIIGQKHHVEVRGLAGDWPEAVVIEGEDDLVALPDVLKIGVVSQTTQPWPKVQQLVRMIRERRLSSEVEWIDTICRPTKERQQALEELCAQVEVLIVVGGKGSNNTRQLVQRGEELGCVAHQVETVGDFREEWLEGVGRVGLTAGTSTLEATVYQVRDRILALARARGASLPAGGV